MHCIFFYHISYLFLLWLTEWVLQEKDYRNLKGFSHIFISILQVFTEQLLDGDNVLVLGGAEMNSPPCPQGTNSLFSLFTKQSPPFVLWVKKQSMWYRTKRVLDLLSPLCISIQVYHTSKISFLHLAFPGLSCNQYGPSFTRQTLLPASLLKLPFGS